MSLKTTSVCLGHAKLTTLTTAVGLAVPQGATACILRCETQPVRFRDDGTDPTSATGMLLLAADVPYFYDGNLNAIKFIETAASAALNVAFYA